MSNLKGVGWCIKPHTDAPWLQDCVDWPFKRHLLSEKYSWNEVFWQPKAPLSMALRGEPSDFTSVLHTGLKHKNKQIFCSAQFFQTAWLTVYNYNIYITQWPGYFIIYTFYEGFLLNFFYKFCSALGTPLPLFFGFISQLLPFLGFWATRL